MTYNYTYHEHLYYKPLHTGLIDYINETYAGKDIPEPLAKYASYLYERFNPDPMSILDYYESDEDEFPLNDREDRRYPSNQFLISLRETVMQMTAGKFRMIMRAVCDAWWDFHDDDFANADDKTLTYRLYTAGWSGNEDILDALLGNPSIRLSMDVDNDGAVWTLKYRLSDFASTEIIK